MDRDTPEPAYTQDEPGDCWATRDGQRETHDLRACEHFLPFPPDDYEIPWLRG